MKSYCKSIKSPNKKLCSSKRIKIVDHQEKYILFIIEAFVRILKISGPGDCAWKSRDLEIVRVLKWIWFWLAFLMVIKVDLSSVELKNYV